jgi:Ca2+-binding RTX toxin-like protein
LVSIAGKLGFNDVINGGGGNDTLQLPDGGAAFFLHNAYSAFNSGVTLTNDTIKMPCAARLASVETINGGSGDDIIDLSSWDYAYGGVWVRAGAGNDVIWGSSGNDILDGFKGNDTMFGGAGDDLMYGLYGNNTFQFVKNNGHDTIEYFTPGEDHLRLFGAKSLSEVTVTLTDHVTVTWQNDIIELVGVTSTAIMQIGLRSGEHGLIAIFLIASETTCRVIFVSSWFG